MSIKNCIFDFGQVIVHFDPEYMTSRFISDKNDIELVSGVLFDRLYWDRLDDGTITDAEVIEGVCSRLPKRLHESAISVYENWYMNIPMFEGMKELLETLKQENKRLYLLSNISIGFADNYHKNSEVASVLSLFDGLIFSGKLNMVKPERDIFEYLIKNYELDPSETVFIDDSPKNISGAAVAGIKGYLFDGDVERLSKTLRA